MKKIFITALFLLLFLAGCNIYIEGKRFTPSPELPPPQVVVQTLPPAEAFTPPSDLLNSPTPPPSSPALTAEVVINANCRSGPGTMYQVVSGYFSGEKVNLVGVNPDGDWWVVRISQSGGECWIWGQLLSLDTAAQALPVYPVPPTPVVPAAGPGDLAFELALLDLINQERARVGAGALVMEPRLVAAARSHSTDMAFNDFFSHTGTGGSDVGERIAQQGYWYSIAGETLCAGGDVNICVQMWLESPSHHDAMLDPRFTQVGIGVFWYTESTHRVYVTADYASP